MSDDILYCQFCGEEFFDDGAKSLTRDAIAHFRKNKECQEQFANTATEEQKKKLAERRKKIEQMRSR